MDYKFTPEEYKNIGNYLLLELGVAGVLTESQVKKIHAQSRILNEEAEIDDGIVALFDHEESIVLMESQETRTTFEGGFIIFTMYDREHSIDPATFASAYMDPKNTQPRDVLRAVGIPISYLDRFEQDRGRGQFNNRLIRLVDVYNENVASLDGDLPALPKWSQRKKVIHGMKQAAVAQNTSVEKLSDVPDYQYEPSDKQIDGGKRGRRDNIISKINNAEITPGEFYRDLTRISRSRRRNWLRFWQKDLSRMKPQRRTLLGRLIGKAWRRSFLLGYQVNNTIFYEVWYNSIDSSFSVYDRNGVEVHYAVPTLQEAIRLLIRTIAQEAPGDAEVFSGGASGRQLSGSLHRSLTQSLGTDIAKLRSEEQARSAEIEREKKERLERKEDIKRDRNQQEKDDKKFRRRRAAQRVASRGQTADAWSQSDEGQSVRDVISRARDSRAGRWAANGQQRRAKSGEMDPTLQSDAQKAMDDMQIKAARESNEKALDELRLALEDIYDVASSGDIDILKQSQNPASRAMSGYVSISANSPMIAVHREELDILRSRVEEEIAEIEKRLGSEASIMRYAQEQEKKTMTKTPSKRDVIAPILADVSDRIRRINRGSLNESMMSATQRYRMQQDQEARRRDEEMAKEDPMEFLSSRDADRRANEIRNRAEASPYNKQLLIQDINDSIETYDVTRVRQSTMKWLIPSWLGRLRRGRRSPIQTPGDVRGGLFNRAKQFFLGEEFRADFVMGYSMSGIIDIEIWYITEIDPNGSGRMLSTFYVYDVTAQKIIRSHLPYLRNAIPVVAAKMGVNAGGL